MQYDKEINISIGRMEEDLNLDESSPSKNYDSFKLINNLYIKTKDSVD